MLFGIARRLLHCLEMVQRSAARVVMQLRRGDRQSMTSLLQRLHWLPVKKRIEFKILVLVLKALYEGQPVYLASLLRGFAKLKINPKSKKKIGSGWVGPGLIWIEKIIGKSSKNKDLRLYYTIPPAWRCTWRHVMCMLAAFYPVFRDFVIVLRFG